MLNIYHCLRCGYEWASRKPDQPKNCASPKCRSPYWNKPKTKQSGPQSKKIEFGTVIWCPECDRIVEETEPIYECGSCYGTFSRSNSADGMGHNCPECYKWGHKISDLGCPDCGEEAEEKEGGECPYCKQTILKEGISENICPVCGKKLAPDKQGKEGK
jgi:DNA-directed RNA polymerase subunit RPC12/RpoP